MMKVLFAAFLLCATRARAQETRDTFAVKEVVVSATRVPLARSALSASVSVLKADDLRQRGLRTVADALREVPGAALSQGGSFGAFGSLFLRGGESDYVQVLIDGVQVNSPGEHFDFGSFTLENIDRIEIVRGPVSVLYGSDAVSGVVQLFTRNSNQAHYDVSFNSGRGDRLGNDDGSFGAQAFNGQFSGGATRLNYSAGLSHLRSNGAYALNNKSRNTGVTGRMQFSAANGATAGLTARYNRNDYHYPTDGSGNVVDANQQDRADAFSAGLELAHRFHSRFEGRAQLGFSRNDDKYNDDKDSPADTLDFYGYLSDERFQRESAELRLNYFPKQNTTVTLGAETDHQRERGSNLSLSQFGKFDGSSREERTNHAAFAQIITDIGHIHFQGGARIDGNEQFGTFATYRGGAAVNVTPTLKLRASAGTGFKQPRFFEQFASGFIKGNPALEPETSRSFDGGVEFEAGGIRISATLFAQRFRNLIQYYSGPANYNGPNYMNLGGARADGFEVEAEHSFEEFTARISFTKLSSEVTESASASDITFAEGERLLRRPEFSAAAALSYNLDGWVVGGSAKYVGERDDVDFSTFQRVTLDSYLKVDVSSERPVGFGGIRLTARVENVMGEKYEEAFNFPARGRMVFLGARLTR
ncbi:MAG TPA: TonB-dependent receptor [Longimicrobiales bacterium]|nr:TonB-dependent receptor [Longimicrobiales bacterium]